MDPEISGLIQEYNLIELTLNAAMHYQSIAKERLRDGHSTTLNELTHEKCIVKFFDLIEYFLTSIGSS